MRKFLSDFESLELYLDYLSDNSLTIFIPENGFTTITHQIIQYSNSQFDLIDSIDRLSLYIAKMPKYHYGWDNEEVFDYFKNELNIAFEIVNTRSFISNNDELYDKLLEYLYYKFVNSISHPYLILDDEFDDNFEYIKLDLKFCLRQQVRLYIQNG